MLNSIVPYFTSSSSCFRIRIPLRGRYGYLGTPSDLGERKGSMKRKGEIPWGRPTPCSFFVIGSHRQATSISVMQCFGHFVRSRIVCKTNFGAQGTRVPSCSTTICFVSFSLLLQNVKDGGLVCPNTVVVVTRGTETVRQLSWQSPSKSYFYADALSCVFGCRYRVRVMKMRYRVSSTAHVVYRTRLSHRRLG